MLIRLLRREDHQILDAAVRMFRNVKVRDHTPFLADPATIAFVALEDSEVIGWAWGNRQRHVGGYSQVQLYEIEVSPGWRGRGIGRALVARFLQLAAAEGHKRMWLFTDHANTAAVALYRSAGGQPAPHDDASFWWRLNDPTA